MARANQPRDDLRVLCMGNDILADDCLGIEVARRTRRALPDVPVVESMSSGLDLLDDLTGVRRLLVVDVVQTGTVPPGTLLALDETDFDASSVSAPHYIGVFDALRLARQLGLSAAEEVSIIAVEADDCLTVGGRMSDAVRGAIPAVMARVESWVATSALRTPPMWGECGDGSEETL